MSATIDLEGPSTTPGAPQVSPAAINAAVNAALAFLADQIAIRPQTFLGGYNASTNVPAISAGGTGAGGGVKGNTYVVTVAGTVSADGVGAVLAGDQIVNTGASWIRLAFSTGFGTMAAQDAAAIAVTGGSISGQSFIGLAGGDLFEPAATPDFAWSIRDLAGNIAAGVGYDGTFYIATATIGALALTSTLAVPGVVTPSLTVAGDITQAQIFQVPDLFVPVRDSAGNIVSGYGADGSFNVVALNAGSVSVNGAAVGGSTVPNDCLDVRAPAYGAVGDAVESWCNATTTAGGSTLTISNFTGSLTLVQQSTSQALLTVVGANHSGVAFQPYDVGRMLYFVVGGYNFQAPIAEYIDGQNVVLTAAGITPQTAATGTLTWPCFQAFNAGEYLVFDGMGQNQVWTNNVTTHIPDNTIPFGQGTFIAQIASVVAPNQITISTTFPFAWAGTPAHLMWGANDASAVALAAEAAFSSGKRKIYFSGDGNLYLILGLCVADAGRVAYISPPATDGGAALNGVLWVGSNTSSFACDASGLNLPQRVIPNGADANRAADRAIYGRASFQRCNKLSTINLFITGDSNSTPSPQIQAVAWAHPHKFVEEFRRANPGKTVNVYWLGIGGSTFASLADPANTYSNGNTQNNFWNIPRPIVGAPSLVAFLQNANQTASGPAIVPDCVVVFDSGGNDSANMDGASMRALINQVRAISHADGFGPTDVLLQTDFHSVISTTTAGNTGGVALPGVLTHAWFYEYASGLISSSAVASGFGCADLGPMATRACYGYDAMHRSMRAIPSMDVVATPSSPLMFPYRCRDLSTWFTLPGASDSAVWAALTQLDLQISLNRGNRAMLRIGANGNLWFGVSAWGLATTSVCTIGSGSTSLTVAAPTSLTGLTITQSALWPQIGATTAIFNAGMVGQSIVAATGHGGQLQRNFIAGLIDTFNVTLHENCFKGQTLTAVAGSTLTIGGAQFIPQDSNSQPDVVIFYPDGTIFNTQVASGGYVSNTQVTLASPAPQALSAATVQVFVGRMGVRWIDTGLNLSGNTTTVGTFEVDVNRGSIILLYKPSSFSFPYTLLDVPVERFGGAFYPLLIPAASQEIVTSNSWIDAEKAFQPSATPWELRGISTTNSDYYAGGSGPHAGSRLRTEVTDVFYRTQDLCTY